MQIYHYTKDTFEFNGYIDEAIENPLETGEFLIPACATSIEPPTISDNEAAIFDEETQQWNVVPDFREIEYWTDWQTSATITELNIELPSGASLTQPEPPIEILIAQKLARLESATALKIVSGYNSAALGSEHFYPSTETDQLTLVGAVGTGQPRTMPCVPASGDPQNNSDWIAPEHTTTQLTALLNEGADIIQGIKNDYRSRVAAALAATNEAELNEISEVF